MPPNSGDDLSSGEFSILEILRQTSSSERGLPADDGLSSGYFRAIDLRAALASTELEPEMPSDALGAGIGEDFQDLVRAAVDSE